MTRFVLGADIGGTFTDCVAVDEQYGLHHAKSLTTPANFAQGMLDGLGVLAEDIGIELPELLSRADRVSHGTTIGTNLIVERRGARIGLLTTRGHGDAISIMNGHGRAAGVAPEDVYAVQTTDKPTPLIAGRFVAEIDERVDADGDVVVALRDEQVREAVRYLVEEEGVESIAVCFLWSFLNPAHERRAAEIAAEEAPGVYVSISSQVAPRLGEFERMVATVMNSYVGPASTEYIGEAERMLAEQGLREPLLVMQSNGGVVPTIGARAQPVKTIDSGPVGGLAGCAAVARSLGHANVIATDMGGTSFDVGLIVDGQPLVGDERSITGYTYRLPHIDVQSIPCGGGTIARYDADTRALRVGPESAGSNPGPACYNLGGKDATVTDADVILGLIRPEAFLGGRMPLDAEASREAIGRIASELGLSVDEAAAGILRINSHRASILIRQQTIERGHDTRDFTIYAYGGAGPVHAFQYAPELGISEVVVPLGNGASTLSAYGIASSDIVQYNEVEVHFRAPFDARELREAIDAAREQVLESLSALGHADGVELSGSLLMRYAEQFMASVAVPIPEGEDKLDTVLLEEFDREYTRLHGPGARTVFSEAEVYAIRIRAAVPLGREAEGVGAEEGAAGGGEATPIATREVLWPDEKTRTPTEVYDGRLLEPGQEVAGPAIVELPHTSVCAAQGQRVSRHRSHLVLHV